MNQDPDSALSKEQFMKANILKLQTQIDDFKIKLYEISHTINDLTIKIRENEIENRKSQNRRSLLLIILLVIFVFIFLRYYFIISAN